MNAESPDTEPQGQLLRQTLDDLQRAWKSLQTLESMSDDQAEIKAACRALAFIDKASAEFERA